MKKMILIALIICSAATANARPGDPFTQFGCGRNTVSRNDPADKVLSYCGQPTSVQRQPASTQQVYNQHERRWDTVTTSETEQWLYNFGRRGGMVQMDFRDGLLEAIYDKGAGY